MPQLNMQLTPDFERKLARLMRVRGIKTKSDAIRLAVEEALSTSLRKGTTTDFTAWRGLDVDPP
ncbi:MAG TPA: hypothetical protein VGR62_20895 [Candidatus Binatia bacterium]|nr:hypothetical protein [Candidatus Binatia bacterium]